MDWTEFGLIAVASLFMVGWGRYIYAWPNRISRWWHDTNRLHVAYSKVLGVLVILGALLVLTFSLVFKLQLLSSWQGLLPVPVALLLTTLLRPRRKMILPWHRKVS